jgi:ABC-type dipeptide/oligopeptide/nickel transport system permease subunit
VTDEKNRYHKTKLQKMGEFFAEVFKTPSAKLGGILFAIMLLLCIFAPLLSKYGVNQMDLGNKYATPSLDHICGTDSLGRDLWARLLYGGRYSIVMGLCASLCGHIFGAIIGCVAGYFGGKTEMIIMRIMDIISAIPGILLAILISTILGTGFLNTVLALSIGGVPGGVRMIRAQILTERGKEYIEAAEAFNCSKAKIMFGHILPNVLSPMLVSFTMGIGNSITSAAGLSYLGLGVQPPTAEWGAMLTDGIQYFRNYPHMILYPGLAIGICVLAINLMGDGVRDAMDPKMRG